MQTEDLHGTLNPAFTEGVTTTPRFNIYVKQPELEEEPGWRFKLEVVDHKYLDSDGLPITSIAGGGTYPKAFKRASEMVEEALRTNRCIF